MPPNHVTLFEAQKVVYFEDEQGKCQVCYGYPGKHWFNAYHAWLYLSGCTQLENEKFDVSQRAGPQCSLTTTIIPKTISKAKLLSTSSKSLIKDLKTVDDLLRNFLQNTC